MKFRTFVPLPALLLALGGLLFLAAPAQAEACSGTSGVTVVVQYPDGHTKTGCAPGDPGSGYDALTGAGFELTYVPNQNGAICTIDGAPAGQCWGTSSYWAYFHAQRGGSWTYASTGASFNPKPGSVEGWRFGSGKAPSTAPPAAPATPKPTPTAKPTVKPSSKPSTGSTAGSTAGAASGPGQTATSKAPIAATPTAPDATASVSGTPTIAPTATASDGTTPVAGATDDTSSEAAAVSEATTPVKAPANSGGASWVWGVGLLALLGAVGGFFALRRRQG